MNFHKGKLFTNKVFNLESRCLSHAYEHILQTFNGHVCFHTFDPSEFNGCCEDDQMLKSSPMTIESTPLNHYKKYEVINTWC